MAQTIIKIKCTDQKLDAIEAPIVASGGFNENKVHFEFCPLWDNFTKTATFYVKKNEVYTSAVDSSGTCIVPHEVTATPGNMFFGVFGVKQDGTTRTSEVIKYKVVQGAITEDAKPSDPTPDVYEQILAKVAALDYHGHSIADVNGLQVELDGKSENGSEEINSSAAYVKSVPATAAGYAKVNKIGGMTRKTKNLFDPAPIGTKTFIGLTYTTEDGYVKINGTKINGANIHPMTEPNITLPAGTYTVSVRMISGTVSGIEGSGGVFFGINKNSYGQRTTPGVTKVGDVGVRTFTLSEPTLVSSFDIAPDYASVGAVFDNAVFACQFEKSDTATEYEPYFEGLRSAPVTEVESVGANLLDPSRVEDCRSASGSSIEVHGDNIIYNYGDAFQSDLFAFSYWLDVEPNTSYAVSVRGGSIQICYVYTDRLWGNRLATIGVNGSVFNSGDNRRVLIGFYSIGSARTGTSEIISELAIYKGTALPYRPYTHNTLPIPEAVQALDGYGDGVNESVYNYIDFETKQFVKRVAAINMDDMVWNHNEYWASPTLRDAVLINYQNPPLLAENYETHAWTGSTSGQVTMNGTGYIVIKGDSANIPHGMLYYELATPVVTDISDLLSGVNTIPAEEGGTLTMVNEHGYDVPSSITFYTNANDSYLGAKGFVGKLIGTAARAECDSDGNSIKGTYAPKKHTHSFNDLADKPEITTYTISKDGNLIILKGSDGSVSSVVDATGSGGAGAATFTLVKRGNKISLEGSDGSYSEVEDDNTTYTKEQLGLGNVDNTADADKSVKHAISADRATNANAATKATQDGVGNNIVTTYSTKNELNTALNNIATTYATKGEVIGGTVVDITSAVSVSGAMGENPIAKAVDTGSSILILFAVEQSFSDISLTVPESLQSKLVVSAVIDGTKDCAASCGLIGSELGSFSSTYADYGTSLEIKYV